MLASRLCRCSRSTFKSTWCFRLMVMLICSFAARALNIRGHPRDYRGLASASRMRWHMASVMAALPPPAGLSLRCVSTTLCTIARRSTGDWGQWASMERLFRTNSSIDLSLKPAGCGTKASSSLMCMPRRHVLVSSRVAKTANSTSFLVGIALQRDGSGVSSCMMVYADRKERLREAACILCLCTCFKTGFNMGLFSSRVRSFA